MKYKLFFDKKNWVKLTYLYWNNSQNHKYESAFNQSDKNALIYGFYHIYCLIDGWEELVKEQISHIVDSGLYERIQKLYCGVLINNNELARFKEIISSYDKIEIMYQSEDGSLFEFKTLYELRRKAEELPPFVGFYFHTKGISWIHTNPKIYNVCNTWRKMNEYFLFDRYRLAIHTLNSKGYDVYGTNYTQIYNDKYRNLGLNFFWFKSDYVKSLPYLEIEDRSSRFLSEAWICSRTHNVYSPFWFTGNDRNVAIPEVLYKTASFLERMKVAIPLYFTRFKWYVYNFTGKYSGKNPLVEKVYNKPKNDSL